MSDQNPTPSTPGAPQEEGPVFLLTDWPHRALASLVDGVGLWIISSVGSAIGGRGSVLAAITSIISLGCAIWLLVMQGKTGQTPGKRLVKIKLVAERDALPIGTARSILRAIAHLLDGIPCMIGYLFPIWDPKRQTFADKVMGTVVIIDRPPAVQAAPSPTAAPASPNGDGPDRPDAPGGDPGILQ